MSRRPSLEGLPMSILSVVDENGAVSLAALPSLPRWVAWQTEEREPGKPPTKVPYAPSGRRRAKADDPATWGTRTDAERRAALLPKLFGLGGVGLELGDLGDGYCIGGLDLV
jgi:putative DNA primase/helicase